MIRWLASVQVMIVLLLLGVSVTPAQTRDARPCSGKEHRQFDFWIGDWNIKQKILRADGTWFEADAQTSVRSALDGCALIENWSGDVLFFWEGMEAPQSMKGLSVRAYAPKSKSWTINWMDTRGLRFGEHVGVFNNGKGEFFRTVKNPDGKETKTRITFSNVSKSAVHWDLAAGSPDRKSWQTVWIMEMRRK